MDIYFISINIIVLLHIYIYMYAQYICTHTVYIYTVLYVYNIYICTYAGVSCCFVEGVQSTLDRPRLPAELSGDLRGGVDWSSVGAKGARPEGPLELEVLHGPNEYERSERWGRWCWSCMSNNMVNDDHSSGMWCIGVSYLVNSASYIEATNLAPGLTRSDRTLRTGRNWHRY